MEQLKFDFDNSLNNLSYIFENEMQEKLFYKIQENHTWKDKYLYDDKYWKEKLYSDILNIDFSNLQKIIDILYEKCLSCHLQYYGWPVNENKYELDYEVYRFDNDSYNNLMGLFKFINLVVRENKCISCLQKQNKISYTVYKNNLCWIIKKQLLPLENIIGKLGEGKILSGGDDK